YATKSKLAGGEPFTGVVDPHSGEGATVKDVCDVYLDAKKRAVEAKDIQQRTFDEYRGTCVRIADEFGRGRAVATLGPSDFAKLRATLTAICGPVRLGNEVQRVRSVFKFAFDSELIDRPVRFGPEFKGASRRAIRERRNAIGARLASREVLQKLLAESTPIVKAMILLGINAAFGASDIGSLPIGAVDFHNGFIEFPRPKTAMPRRAKLWPETLAALTWVRDNRTTPADRKHEPLLFITQQTGRPWMRYTADGGKIDNVRHEFRKVVLKVGANVHFYDLRRTFRTVADETGDQVAIRLVMGHVSAAGDMDATYRQKIGDDRLEKIAAHVHAWLWPPTPAAPKKKAAPRKKSAAKKATKKTAKRKPAE
ncbi:MAG TPA: site-specific integrase, partial [Pirellulales bacterium]